MFRGFKNVLLRVVITRVSLNKYFVIDRLNTAGAIRVPCPTPPSHTETGVNWSPRRQRAREARRLPWLGCDNGTVAPGSASHLEERDARRAMMVQPNIPGALVAPGYSRTSPLVAGDGDRSQTFEHNVVEIDDRTAASARRDAFGTVSEKSDGPEERQAGSLHRRCQR